MTARKSSEVHPMSIEINRFYEGLDVDENGDDNLNFSIQ